MLASEWWPTLNSAASPQRRNFALSLALVRGCCNLKTAGGQIDWIFEKAKVPLAIDIGIYSTINQGLGIGTKFKKKEDAVREMSLRGLKFEGFEMPDGFGDDQIETRSTTACSSSSPSRRSRRRT